MCTAVFGVGLANCGLLQTVETIPLSEAQAMCDAHVANGAEGVLQNRISNRLHPHIVGIDQVRRGWG